MVDNDQDTTVAEPELPDWQPRSDLDVVQLANALEHIRRSAYSHWLGDEFNDEHTRHYSMIAAQALCGQPIEAPVDMHTPEFTAHIAAQAEPLTDLFDDGLEHAATTVAQHEHDFQPDPDRTHTLYCTVARCDVLKSSGDGHHPHRELRHPDRHLVAIDEGVSPLIKRLWEAGVETRGCCQGGCCEDAEGTASPGWILHAASARDQVAAELASKSRLRWLEPKNGFQRVEWDAETRCVFWDQEHQRRLTGKTLASLRIEWPGR